MTGQRIDVDHVDDDSIRIHGTDDMGRAQEIADAYAELLSAVAMEVSGVDVGWKVAGIVRVCDGGCERRTDGPGLPDGWVHVGGDDLCPDCRVAA